MHYSQNTVSVYNLDFTFFGPPKNSRSLHNFLQELYSKHGPHHTSQRYMKAECVLVCRTSRVESTGDPWQELANLRMFHLYAKKESRPSTRAVVQSPRDCETHNGRRRPGL